MRHRNSDNAEQLKFAYPKFKNGEATVRDVRISQNFGESAVKINSSLSPFTVLYLGEIINSQHLNSTQFPFRQAALKFSLGRVQYLHVCLFPLFYDLVCKQLIHTLALRHQTNGA